MGSYDATRPQGRWHQVRQDRGGHRLAGCSANEPTKLYQFFLRTEDEVVGAYLRFFTFLPHERILELDESTAEHPERREAQRALAHEVVELVHGTKATTRAEEAAAALFRGQVAELDEGALLMCWPMCPPPRSSAPGWMVASSWSTSWPRRASSPSKSRGRTTVEQGGAYVNDRRETDLERLLGPGDLLYDGYVVLRRARATTTSCVSPDGVPARRVAVHLPNA